jgi:hypothetical protein
MTLYLLLSPLKWFEEMFSEKRFTGADRYSWSIHTIVMVMMMMITRRLGTVFLLFCQETTEHSVMFLLMTNILMVIFLLCQLDVTDKVIRSGWEERKKPSNPLFLPDDDVSALSSHAPLEFDHCGTFLSVILSPKERTFESYQPFH